jgi:hypothetical protein
MLRTLSMYCGDRGSTTTSASSRSPRPGTPTRHTLTSTPAFTVTVVCETLAPLPHFLCSGNSRLTCGLAHSRVSAAEEGDGELRPLCGLFARTTQGLLFRGTRGRHIGQRADSPHGADG